MHTTWEMIERKLNVDIDYGMFSSRVESMARMIGKKVRSVCDLGAGNMILRNYLNKEVEYYPVDYLKRYDDTIVCDFNKYEFPKTQVDAYFVSGTLEYVKDYMWFIEKICESEPREIILSYNVAREEDRGKPRQYTICGEQGEWENSLTLYDIISIFRELNYEIRRYDDSGGLGTIIKLERNSGCIIHKLFNSEEWVRMQIRYWQGQINIGDYLSEIITKWMLRDNKMIMEDSLEDPSDNIDIYTVGSILGEFNKADKIVVWGSGVHFVEDACKLSYWHEKKLMDIRAVRGPITRRVLMSAGYVCPQLYGDPAILMPLIYKSDKKEQKGKISVVRHWDSADNNTPKEFNTIDPRTHDYHSFIDEICTSQMIISSSLHGIILAESYHVPAIWLIEEDQSELLKYYDWYYSTGRKQINYAFSIEEAAQMKPMPLPDLTKMQKRIMEAFPTDVFIDKSNIKKDFEFVLFGKGKMFQDRIKYILSRIKVKFVCDNDEKKYGIDQQTNIECLSLDTLNKRMNNAYIIITLYDAQMIRQVEKQLREAGIFMYATYYEWERYMNWR